MPPNLNRTNIPERPSNTPTEPTPESQPLPQPQVYISERVLAADSPVQVEVDPNKASLVLSAAGLTPEQISNTRISVLHSSEREGGKECVGRAYSKTGDMDFFADTIYRVLTDPASRQATLKTNGLDDAYFAQYLTPNSPDFAARLMNAVFIHEALHSADSKSSQKYLNAVQATSIYLGGAALVGIAAYSLAKVIAGKLLKNPIVSKAVPLVAAAVAAQVAKPHAYKLAKQNARAEARAWDFTRSLLGKADYEGVIRITPVR